MTEEEGADTLLHIVDARSHLAAEANKLRQKGFESTARYRNTRLYFQDIGNIHTMRDSLNQLEDAIHQTQEDETPDISKPGAPGAVSKKGPKSAIAVAMGMGLGSGLGVGMGMGMGAGTDTSKIQWLEKLEKSGWLQHVRLVVRSSVLVAELLLVEAESVLVHCSDGWDRTAQLCATAKLLVDPHYRTVKGFANLVEMEWCAFGFKVSRVR
jgi:myotubularin-related protein 1/2